MTADTLLRKVHDHMNGIAIGGKKFRPVHEEDVGAIALNWTLLKGMIFVYVREADAPLLPQPIPKAVVVPKCKCGEPCQRYYSGGEFRNYSIQCAACNQLSSARARRNTKRARERKAKP